MVIYPKVYPWEPSQKYRYCGQCKDSKLPEEILRCTEIQPCEGFTDVMLRKSMIEKNDITVKW